ncbi:MAG: helicase SNF2, partial [Polaromonas sp.]
MQNQAPGRSVWFDASSLEALTDAGAWARGLPLYRGQKVLQLDIEPQQDHWLLVGEVQGSLRAPYEVRIEMALLPDGQVDFWNSHCTCPVGRQCKHGVALMLKAAYQGLHLLGHAAASVSARQPPSPEAIEAGRMAAQARADEAARQLADAQLLGWLQALDHASGKDADLPREMSRESRGQHRPEQYVYLLTILGGHGPTPQLNLEARVSYPKTTGGWAKPKVIRSPPHQGQPVFDAASEADREVLQLLLAMPNHSRYYSAYSASPSAAPSGRAGQIALQQAASTGRLFADDGSGYPGQAIQWGPPQTLDWQWQQVPTPNASEPGWALRARLASADATLCLNSPPLYLDSAQGLCGPVQA